MQYEIDYIPVGTGEKGGDAIVFRYGDFSDITKQYVVVIDGGTKDSGKLLVEHIKQYYGTTHVDLIIASHLHNDHISGLTEVLENLTVTKIAVHCPWDHTLAIKKMTNTTSTLGKLQTKLEKSLSGLSTLVDLAESKKIPVIQPFQGEKILGSLYVLGPSKAYYQQLLANFGVTPEVKEEHRIDKMISTAKEAITWVAEALNIETLTDDYLDTDPENNSSLVLLLVCDGKKFLFTGDAGKDAIGKVIEYTDAINFELSGLDFFDAPHHGSKRNLGPTILNKLKPKQTFISCPPQGDPKHPSRKVINALLRRDSAIHTNKHGFTLCYPSANAPVRQGWKSATPESFYEQVEE
ncbi:MAG: MBL fold metallo-hydrolase [Candidatus Levybacteria bacterium]|nr:MBL fold metallo-hydrolase [Candidatus Levybacteria bacterium]